MFFILDTDHFSALDRDSAAGKRFEERRLKISVDIFITVVTVEEVMRGWLGLLGRTKKRFDEIAVYQRMKRSAELIGQWDILPWDEESFAYFEKLRAERVRLSTLDLKIACTALAHDATLLTRNSADFGRVPELKIDNWLD